MEPIPVRLPRELQERVDHLAKRLSISRSSVLRLAIVQWLDAADRHGMNPMIREEEMPTESAMAERKKTTCRQSRKKKPES